MLHPFETQATSYAIALLFGGLITVYSSVGIFVIFVLMLAIRFSPERTLYSVYKQSSLITSILSVTLAVLVNIRCANIDCFMINLFGDFVIFMSFFSMRGRVYSAMGIADKKQGDELGVKEIWNKTKDKKSDIFK